MSVPAYVRYGHPISTRALDKYDLTMRLPFPRLYGDS